MGQFSNSFPKHFSYLCEYAFRFDLSCSFCEYPFIFHCLHCSPSCFDPDSLLLAYYWLGLSWIDCISSKQKLFISKNKQQETLHQQQAAGEAKHSAETTINFFQCSKGFLYYKSVSFINSVVTADGHIYDLATASRALQRALSPSSQTIIKYAKAYIKSRQKKWKY